MGRSKHRLTGPLEQTIGLKGFFLYIIAFLVGCLAPLTRAQAEIPRRVLIVHSFGREYAPYRTVTSTFRTQLARQSAEPIEFHDVSLEAARFSDGAMEQTFAEYLHALFAGRRLDLIVPFGAPAVRFCAAYRSRISDTAPMLVAAVDQRHLRDLQFDANTAVVSSSVNLPRTFEHILKLLPNTTNLTLLLGTSPLEQYWLGQTKEACQSFTNRISLSFVDHLTLEQMWQQLSTLPPRSAVLYLLVTVDAAGVPYEQDAALKALTESANAPVFGLFDTQLEHGIVGGPVLSLAQVGSGAAAVALRILKGESPSSIQPLSYSQDTYIYNWRELQRWKVPQTQLPPGSMIRFRPPSPWEQHRGYIIAAIAIIAAQSMTIAGFVLQRMKRVRAESERRQTEEAAVQLSGKLITAQEDERKRIARDLHDDLNQRLALVSVEMELLSRDSAPADIAARKRIDDTASHVKQIATDVHNLAYRLHPAKLDQLGLVAASRTLCRELSAQFGVRVDFEYGKIPRDLARNLALCLYRVLQESIQNSLRHSGAKNVHAEIKTADGGLLLTVSDAGKGFDANYAMRNGGLGLISMRERIRQVGGTFVINSSPEKGTRIEVITPLMLESRNESVS